MAAAMTPRSALVRALAALLLADMRSESAASGASSPGNARTIVGTLHPPAVTERPATLAEAGKDGQPNDCGGDR